MTAKSDSTLTSENEAQKIIRAGAGERAERAKKETTMGALTRDEVNFGNIFIVTFTDYPVCALAESGVHT